MTKLELTIRQVSDLRDFYLKIKKEREGVSPAATRKKRRECRKSGLDRKQ